MFNYLIKAGTADVSVVIRIIDSTDGTPETGVVWNTAGIDMEYRREGAAVTDITEATLAALTTAHSDGGFLHISNGYYRLDLPDAACAAGVTGVLVEGTVTGMVVIGCYIQLVTFDPFDTVRLGLTALPNAAADAAGGLPISDAGGLDMDSVKTDTAAILVDTGTTLDTKINTIDDFLDTEIAAILAAVDTEVAAILEDTANMQLKLGTPAADVSADIAAMKVDTAAILVDTGTTLDGKINTIDDFVDTEIGRIIQILTGKWEITNNQLIMYDSDGTTALYTFNLTQDGTATEFNPDKRDPV